MKKSKNTSDKQDQKDLALGSIVGQKVLIKEISKILDIFSTSNAEIRPHFFLTGPSGASKTFLITLLTEIHDLNIFSINAAQLTKEGVSGNSLSKSLTPLLNQGSRLTVCFVDEYDKLFISGNSNESSAHESTTGVQNEFLHVLEHPTTQVFGDYGKYITVPTNNVLFVFAGAFNNEPDIDIDRLRDLGVKTEFLGRVPLIFNAEKLSLEDLEVILDRSPLLDNYLKLFKDEKRDKVTNIIKGKLAECYEKNDLGARIINSLIHQYFVKGGFKQGENKKVTFQRNLTLD